MHNALQTMSHRSWNRGSRARLAKDPRSHRRCDITRDRSCMRRDRFVANPSTRAWTGSEVEKVTVGRVSQFSSLYYLSPGCLLLSALESVALLLYDSLTIFLGIPGTDHSRSWRRRSGKGRLSKPLRQMATCPRRPRGAHLRATQQAPRLSIQTSTAK